jgi:hypothetical protein
VGEGIALDEIWREGGVLDFLGGRSSEEGFDEGQVF